jgi:hypothetical protein
MKNHMFAVVLLAVTAAPAFAQTTETIRRRQPGPEKQAAEETGVFERQVKIVGPMRERVAVEARTTAGAPYSAEAVTESTQVLADGNRINRKVTTRIYRDSEGRTRREQINEAGAVDSTFVTDPTSGTSFVFEQNPQGVRGTMTGLDVVKADGNDAFTTGTFKGNVAFFAAPDGVESGAVMKSQAEGEAQEKMAITTKLRHVVLDRASDGQSVREDLGVSTIEGLAAKGTRTTTTIAAGAIGNLQPITITSEEWFAPDLQVLVLTKYSDPRSGETVYRLINVVRAEPDRSLFTMPADEPGGKPGMRTREDNIR